jgi:hypothetical protein
MSTDIQEVKTIEELFEKYAKEGSLEKLLVLYKIVQDGLDAARIDTIARLGTVKPFLEVYEDLVAGKISSIPFEAKELLKAREPELIPLLVRDASSRIEKLDPLTQRLVALLVLVLENKHGLPSLVGDLYDLYEVLTGEHIPEEARRECSRNLLELHLLETLYFDTYKWSPYAPYILRALKNKVPKVLVEFKMESEEK